MPLRLSGDFETASCANLTRCGAYKYARDPSTRILCFAWAIDDEEPSVWFPSHELAPARMLKALARGAEFHAWNANFEFNIWNVCGVALGLPALPLEAFHCTMARALYWGLPAKLETAAPISGTAMRKDAEGARLMQQMTKPRAEDADGTLHWWDLEDADKRLRLGEYCQQDVRTERAIGWRLKPMPAHERSLWQLDQRMNGRGLKVDVVAVKAMQTMVDGEVKRIGARLSLLTGGKVWKVTQTKRLLDYLKSEKVVIDGLSKGALPPVLADANLDSTAREILLTYQEGAKTSTAKLKAMTAYLDDDQRVRGLTQYGGALRTLRWAGRGVQIQNYPRPTKAYDLKWALDDILRGVDAEALALTHGSPMDVVSQCLRGAYVPAQGHAFAVADYAAIEARVVAWLAGEDRALAVFRRNQDIYIAAARAVMSADRDLGKVLTLACGFGMGPKRFVTSAAAPPYFITLTFEEAQRHVWAWRDANSAIRDLWRTVDSVVRAVIQDQVKDQWTPAGPHLAFRMGRGSFEHCLLMRLPSDRWIVYREASIDLIVNDEDGLADEEEVIRYSGLDFSKKWVRVRTWGGKLVENATQATARDLLADAMLRLDTGEDDLCATVHDELIAEPRLDEAPGRLKTMLAVMSTGPDWAHGLPLAATGAIMARYGKS
jgi:DNA polymerase